MGCECAKGRLDLFVLRLMLGLVMLPHGLQKTLGMFGGYGFSGTMQFFTGTAGLPWIIALMVILAESAGALMLILGIATRFAAFGIGCVMVGAIFKVHLANGFFMNWFGNQAGEGFEYHLLALGMAAALMIGGGGKWALCDCCCFKKSGGSCCGGKGKSGCCKN